jgi:TfoX/Sxy family transcriptional regulator of competence genes
MATKQSTIDFLLDQISQAGVVSALKMFGEYGIYCDGKMPALVCNDELFIKPTEAGRAYIGEVEEVPPYSGAKPYFLISGEKWDDQEWLSELFVITTREIPLPIKKKKAARKSNQA